MKKEQAFFACSALCAPRGGVFLCLFLLPASGENVCDGSERFRFPFLKSSRIYVKRRACLRVSENALNRLDVHALRDEQGSVQVSEAVQVHFREIMQLTS